MGPTVARPVIVGTQQRSIERTDAGAGGIRRTGDEAMTDTDTAIGESLMLVWSVAVAWIAALASLVAIVGLRALRRW